jgi:hypothetical protein
MINRKDSTRTILRKIKVEFKSEIKIGIKKDVQNTSFSKVHIDFSYRQLRS